MPQKPPQPSDPDPFDTLLTLEDTLYTTAYTAGTTAGALSGRIQGRIFGLEKGFESFTALGELHGRSVVWGGRLPSLSAQKLGEEQKLEKHGKVEENEARKLSTLPLNSRLQNNITLLHALTDPDTFDTANTEEAVADFDDRFKRAGAKAKVIERIVGESGTTSASKSHDESPARGKGGPVRVVGEGKKMGKKGDDSIEDFAGSRLLR